MRFTFEIYDRYEGMFKYSVTADTLEAAEEEADIHASEMGCKNVEEIILMEGIDNPEKPT
jgi:hypothetical protein